ncbi:MAG TPA: adenylate kinase [Bryobacteraceae bacterium]|nr:adenylate kinase [Bryobacteraceae bacterium]
MIVLLFGPPGCGKGTQAALLAQRLVIPAISTGEAFRAECQKGTELGKMASAIMKSGGLVGDDIVNGIVASRISQPDCADGYLLDGYPRTVPQAVFLTNFLRETGQHEPVVIHLDVASDALVTRLTARRQCPECGRIYNLLSQPPRTAGECDDDRAPLLTRDDDQEAVIRRRLRAYHEQTGPILEWYGERVVQTIDGAAPADEVGRAILEIVRREAAARELVTSTK